MRAGVRFCPKCGGAREDRARRGPRDRAAGRRADRGSGGNLPAVSGSPLAILAGIAGVSLTLVVAWWFWPGGDESWTAPTMSVRTVASLEYTDPVQVTIGPDGGTLEHPSGARVRFPPGAVEQPTVVRAAAAAGGFRTFDAEVRGTVIEVTTDQAVDEFPQPVTVTIPFEGDAEGITGAYWRDGFWRPMLGEVDAERNEISFPTLHFTSFTAVRMGDQRLDWAEVKTDEVPVSKRGIPRGTVAVLSVPLPAWVEIGDNVTGTIDASDTLLAFRYPDAATFTGAGSVRRPVFGRDTPDSMPERGGGFVDRSVDRLKFLVFVPDDAELGWRDLTIYVGNEPITVQQAFFVAPRLAIVVDIDGLRQDVFYEVLQGERDKIPTLAGLFGKPIGDQTVGSWGALGFEHGLAIKGATTVFPSYTFAGHAAIFTGRTPSEYGFPGNEWLDRLANPPRRYAFTSHEVPVWGGAIAHRSSLEQLSQTGVAGYLPTWSSNYLEKDDPSQSFDSDGLANSVLWPDPRDGDKTVYDKVAALGLESVISFNMYFGDAVDKTHRIPASFGDQLTYAVSRSGEARWYDSEMAQELGEFLAGEDNVGLRGLRTHRIAAATFYFGGLDHGGHLNPGRVVDKHRDTLPLLDAQIGKVIDMAMSQPMVKQAMWIVTADHGQSDVKRLVEPTLRELLARDPVDITDVQRLSEAINEADLGGAAGFGPTTNVPDYWAGVRAATEQAPAPVPGAPRDSPLRCDLESSVERAALMAAIASGDDSHGPGWRKVEESDCVIGLNGGSAHVYLRAKPPYADGPATWAPWSGAPSTDRVLEVAEYLRTQAQRGGTWWWPGTHDIAEGSQIDLILVRIPEGGSPPPETRGPADPFRSWPYQVYDMNSGQVTDLSSYLAGNAVFFDGPSDSCRYCWDSGDRAFIEEAIQGMNSSRSGDIVLLARYPDFFFEHSYDPGAHGGLVSNDMLVPLAVAVPGESVGSTRRAPTDVTPSLTELVASAIDMRRKVRPGNRDVPALVLRYQTRRVGVTRTELSEDLVIEDVLANRSTASEVKYYVLRIYYWEASGDGRSSGQGEEWFELVAVSPERQFDAVVSARCARLAQQHSGAAVHGASVHAGPSDTAPRGLLPRVTIDPSAAPQNGALCAR